MINVKNRAVNFRGSIYSVKGGLIWTEYPPYDQNVGFDSRGTGIYAINSSFITDTIIIRGIFSQVNGCLFTGLNYGIYGMRIGTGNTDISAHHSTFNDNHYGIYLSSYLKCNPVIVHANNFHPSYHSGLQNSYGLYFNNCTGYKADSNTFTGNFNPSSSGTNQFGLIVNNSGSDWNYIYNNKFNALFYSLQSLNVNRGDGYLPDLPGTGPPDFRRGLCFICNDFTGTLDDILINKDLIDPPAGAGVSYYQKNVPNPQYPDREPAGNSFSQDHDPNGTRYDIDIDADVENIQYWFHDACYPPGSKKLLPVPISNSSKVQLVRKYVTYSSTTCPPDFYPPGFYLQLHQMMSQSQHKIDSLISLLNILTDAGNTDTLKNKVLNSNPNQSYDVYQDLMNPSPYLSDTVLKTAILMEDVLPNPMIRDIMVANPQSAKNEDLLNTLDNRINPMPDSLWAEILQGMDTIGAMERLESELAGWIQNKELYFNCLIDLFLSDTIHSWANDSLVALMQNEHSLYSKYTLANYYLDHHNFALAGNILQEIPVDFSLRENQLLVNQRYQSLFSLLQQLYNDTLGLLIPDSTQQASLEQLSANDNDIPGAIARNILIACGKVIYQEPIITASDLKSSRYFRQYGKKTSITSQLKVYPNPCHDYIIVEYKKKTPQDNYSLSLLNSNGVLEAKYMLVRSADQVIIPLTGFTPGIYVLQLSVNGSRKEVSKILIK